MKAYRIGAVFYALWGIMHIMFGVQMLLENSAGGARAVLDAFYLDIGPEPTPEALGSTTGAILFQHAWNLLWFGMASTFVAVFMNWRNSPSGFWINLVLISAADIGFVGAVMVPGYIDLWVGIWGPVLWIPGLVLTGLGLAGRTAKAAA